MDWKQDIDENVRSGLLELLILDLLCDRDMYGYEIRGMIKELTNGAFEICAGSLYTPVYRMAKRNLISSHKEYVGVKRVRRYYHIEEAGREYLAYGKEQIKIVFAGVNALLNRHKGGH